MFWSKNKKNRYTPANPSFTIIIKVGFKGVYIARTCFPDVCKYLLVAWWLSIMSSTVRSILFIHLLIYLFIYSFIYLFILKMANYVMKIYIENDTEMYMQ